MTPQDYELLQLRAQLLAKDIVIEWMAGMWSQTLEALPAGQQSTWRSAMAARLKLAVADYQTMTLPMKTPAESELHAGEFQDAFDAEVKKLIAAFSLPE